MGPQVHNCGFGSAALRLTYRLPEDDGATIYLQACAMGLEGIVSKRLSAPYRSGPSRDWLKIKNPNSPAMVRHREGHW
jgi:bifunctional non-homologous end joining protein LigD